MFYVRILCICIFQMWYKSSLYFNIHFIF